MNDQTRGDLPEQIRVAVDALRRHDRPVVMAAYVSEYEQMSPAVLARLAADTVLRMAEREIARESKLN